MASIVISGTIIITDNKKTRGGRPMKLPTCISLGHVVTGRNERRFEFEVAYSYCSFVHKHKARRVMPGSTTIFRFARSIRLEGNREIS